MAGKMPCKKTLSSSQHKNNNLLLNEVSSENLVICLTAGNREDLITAPVVAWASSAHLCAGERQCCVRCFHPVPHHVGQHTLMWPDAAGNEICAKLLNRRDYFNMLNTVVMLGMFLNAFVIKQSIVYMHGFSTQKKKKKQLAITARALEIITSTYGVSCPNACIYAFVWNP